MLVGTKLTPASETENDFLLLHLRLDNACEFVIAVALSVTLSVWRPS
jgi:hypothetical protein